METTEGYTVIEGKGGWWTYALINEEGFLTPSDYLVGKDDPKDISELQLHLSNDYPDVEEDPGEYGRPTRAPPTNTTWKAVAIMLEFTDEIFDTTTKSDFETLRQTFE